MELQLFTANSRSMRDESIDSSQGGPVGFVISPSRSVLSFLNRISLQLTLRHATGGSLISPVPQSFCFSILLRSKGHTFYFHRQVQST